MSPPPPDVHTSFSNFQNLTIGYLSYLYLTKLVYRCDSRVGAEKGGAYSGISRCAQSHHMALKNREGFPPELTGI